MAAMVLIVPTVSAGHRRFDDDAVRDRLLVATTALLRERSVQTMSLQVVSHAADVPLVRLRGLFPTWTSLQVAALLEWHGRRVTAASFIARQDGAAAFLRAIVQANLAEPALSRALVSTIAVVATPDCPSKEVLEREWGAFHQFVLHALIADISAGREPVTMDPARGAEQLIAVYEGLQLQAMLRPGMHLLEAFDRAVARLRFGWTAPYNP